MFPHANSLLGSPRSFFEYLAVGGGAPSAADGSLGGGNGGQVATGTFYPLVTGYAVTVPGTTGVGGVAGSAIIAGVVTAAGGVTNVFGRGGDAGNGALHSGINGASGLTSNFDGTSRSYGSGGAGDSGTPGAEAGNANQGGGGTTYSDTTGKAGRVVIRYVQGSMTATGGTITTVTISGTIWKVHTFTANGTFTVTAIN